MAEQFIVTGTGTSNTFPVYQEPPAEAKPPDPMFISLDDPVEMPHQDPYEAAKRIRELARKLVDQAPQPSGGKIQGIGALRDYINYCTMYNNDLLSYLNQLEEAIKTRRVSATKNPMSHVRSKQGQLRSYIQYAEKQVKLLQISNAGSNSAAKMTAEEIHKLAQSLPTVSTAPVMPIDQTLRAIATLLKNGGYFNEKGQPVKPGDVLEPDYSDDSDDEDSYEDSDDE